MGNLTAKFNQLKAQTAGICRRLVDVVHRTVSSPRLRSEVLWVGVHKTLEFMLLFAMLKVFSGLLGKAGYGEFSLAANALQVLSALLIMPVQQSYMRRLQAIRSEGSGRDAGMIVLRWYAVVTLSVAVLAFALTAPLGRLLGLGKLTVMATGLMFLGNRWRLLGTNLLDFQRHRKACAIRNLGFKALQVICAVLFVRVWSASASTVLFAVATSAGVFGVISLYGLLRGIASQPKGVSSNILDTVRTYGLATGALLLFQWMQNMADRYILAGLLGTEPVGLYSAGFQVCGIPFLATFALVFTLVQPIAFQRAKDPSEPRQLWSADKVLLGGVGIYLFTGVLAMPVYALFGPRLLTLLTATEFVLPTHTIVILAFARFVQMFGMLVQVFFNIHDRMGSALRFRAIGAVLMLPISWFAIAWPAIRSGASGTLTTKISTTLSRRN